ncbi:GIY-YIG nuclease family protein [Nisaea sp.]|uniref:GIY-YIG nuclease family protein n=1 Tax=Nisaea sp. TaxID=2024842 RepID=UPI003B51C470
MLEAVRTLIPDTGIVHLSENAIAPMPGSYLLFLELQVPRSVKIARRDAALPAGLYAYAGSAKGPGGLRARLGRHLRGDGRTRWHIDQITVQAHARAGFAYRSRTECELVRTLLENSEFSVPIERFGSSDCKTCASHLLQFQAAPKA